LIGAPRKQHAAGKARRDKTDGTMLRARSSGLMEVGRSSPGFTMPEDDRRCIAGAFALAGATLAGRRISA
jgi:hypothetical protein